MIENIVQLPQKTPPLLKDLFGIIGFIILVVIGVFIINTFIFRSFNVDGPSMEKTLYTGDRLIVNKLPVTFAHLQGKEYLPGRGQVIVFKNPLYESMGQDEFIVKRVVGLPKEKVAVHDSKVTVFNKQHPKGFNPDELTGDSEGIPDKTNNVEVVVPDDQLFVIGDHRAGNFSYDSRNGLGTIPLNDVIGPVGLRIFPFQNFRTF